MRLNTQGSAREAVLKDRPISGGSVRKVHAMLWSDVTAIVRRTCQEIMQQLHSETS